tara:strand:+ start:14132 stop:22279 length:8148 start_codon:yes stop_codon:yes gene_type:complete
MSEQRKRGRPRGAKNKVKDADTRAVNSLIAGCQVTSVERGLQERSARAVPDLREHISSQRATPAKRTHEDIADDEALITVKGSDMLESDVEDDAEQNRAGAGRWGSGRGGGGDDDDGDHTNTGDFNDRKERVKERELLPRQQRGLGPDGGGRGWNEGRGYTHLPLYRFASSFPPYKQTTAFQFRLNKASSSSAVSPYNNTKLLRDLADREKMVFWAKKWAVPCTPQDPVRKLPGDIEKTVSGDTVCAETDLNGKALMAISNTLPTPVLHFSKVKNLTNFNICQWPMARPELIMIHGGPTGGVEQEIPIVFSEIEINPVNPGYFSKTMRRLATVLSMCFGGADLKTGIWAVSTDFTEVTEFGKNMGHGGIRMTHEGSLRAQYRKYPWNLSNDIDPHLLHNIIEFRKKHGFAAKDAEPDDEDIIPTSCQQNDPSLDIFERELDDYEREYSPATYSGSLFKFKMIISSFNTYDSDGKLNTIQVTALRMESQLGSCPLTALQHIKSENGYVGEDLLQPLRIIVMGMLDNLGIHHGASDVDKMFDPGYEHNIATYVSEAKLLESIFRVAHKNGLSPPFVGGRRMDVTCRTEMKAWREYANSISKCIMKHWQMVSASVFTLMSARGNMKNVQAAHKDFGDDVKWAGITAMSMSEAAFLQLLHDEVRSEGLDMQARQMAGAPSESDLDDIESEWFSIRFAELKFETGYMDDVAGRNIEYPRMYREDGMVYMFVNGSFIFNSGVIFEILPLGSYTRKGRYQNKQQISASNVEEKMLPDPIDCCAMMSLYYDSTLNLKRFFDEELPLCVKYLERDEVKGDPNLYKLLSSVREAENDFRERHDSDGIKNIRDKQIKFVAGVCTHPIRDLAMNANEFGELSKMARMKDSIVKQMLHKTMEDVARGPLLQMSMTAKVIRNMRIDPNPKQPDFIPFHQNYQAFLGHLSEDKKVPCIPTWGQTSAEYGEKKFKMYDSDPKDFVNLMDLESVGHIFDRWSFLSFDIHVSFLNQMILSLIRNNSLSVFYQCKHEACGTYSIIGDFGGTCNITVEFPNGTIKIQKYTAKASGAGIDFIIGLLTMLNSVFAKYLIHDKKLKEFFNSYASADKLMNKISPLRIHCVLGSAIMTGPNGSYDETDQSIQETGLLVHLPEVGKDEQGESADNILRTLEICGGQPTGTSHNLESITWETSLGCFKMTPTRLMAPTPFITVASNQVKQIVPESTFHGGRATFPPSAVPDDAGIIERHASGQSKQAVDPMDIGENDDDVSSLENDHSATMNAETNDEFIGLGFLFLPDINMSNLKVIDADTARINCIYFWVQFLMRRVIAYAGKTMTLHYVPRENTFNTTLAGIHKGIHHITIGSWRFGTTKQAFHRKFSSVVRTNLLVAEHIYALAIKSTLLACSMPKMIANEPVVNMAEAFDNLVMSILNVPPSITTVLSTLYLWLSTDALDMHVPVLVNFCLYTMNIQTGCPLHILALAARGESLTEEQERRFDYIAERFCRPCCERRVTSQDNMLLTVGQLKPIIKDGDHNELLDKMFGENSQLNYDELSKLSVKRKKDWQPSTYICANMTNKTPFETSAMPEWAVKSNFKDRRQSTSKSNTWETTALKLFADTQKREVLASRQQEKAQPTHHDTLPYWDAVKDGWRLPNKPQHVTDKTTLNFKTPHEESLFYETTLRDSRQFSCGIRKTWLHMCGLSESNSTNEIMTRIFKRWLDKHPGLAFPTSPAWMAKFVADSNVVPSKFAIGVQMLPKPAQRKFTLESMLGIHIVDAVIGSGLLKSECRTPFLYQNVSDSIPDDAKVWDVHNWRVMSQMVLQILSLLCHMAFEKSVIPAVNAANGNTLRGKGIILRGCSPYEEHFKETTGPEVYIDERLFLDRGDILSSNSRMVKNMSIVSLKEGEQMMMYRHVQEGEGASLVQSKLDLPSYPPESMAHALSYCRLYDQIMKKYITGQEATLYGPECYLPHALNEYLSSMHTMGEYRGVEKFSAAFCVTPTFCTTQTDCEMLFVTSRHNFVFSVKTNADGTFTVNSAEMTHNFQDMTFSALPLRPWRNNFRYQDFAFFTCGGLKLMKDGSVVCRHPTDITKNVKSRGTVEREDLDANVVEVLAAVPLPITPFPAFCIVCPINRCMTMSAEGGTEKRQMLVLNTHKLFLQDVANHSSEESTMHWIETNPDVPPLNPDWKLHVIYRSCIESSFGRTWINVGNANLQGWNEIDEPDILEVLVDYVDRCESGEDDAMDVYDDFNFSDENWEFISSHNMTFTQYLSRTSFFQVGKYKFVPKLFSDPRVSFWATKSDTYVYFKTREELKYTLMHNHGQPMTLNEGEEWIFPDSMVQTEHLLKANDGDLYTYLPLIKREDKKAIHEYLYTDDDFVNAWNSILLLHQKFSTNSDRLRYLEKESKKSGSVASETDSSGATPFSSASGRVVSDMTSHIEKNQDVIRKTMEEILQKKDNLHGHIPSRSLQMSWDAILDTLSWNIRACEAGNDPETHVLGTLVRFGSNMDVSQSLDDVAVTNRYIRNGQYMISFLYEGQFWQSRMDAITTMMSFKQEGTRVWICLNAQRYTDLMNAIPGAYLEHRDDHFAVLNGERKLYLSGFYVISDDESKTASTVTMLVMVQIQEKISENADFKFENRDEQKALVHVKVYDYIASAGEGMDDGEDDEYVTMIHTDAPVTDEDNTTPYIMSSDEKCGVVNFLTRTKYNTQSCRHGNFVHAKTSASNTIYLRR